MPFHEVCPFRIGSRVKVKPDHKHASEWPGSYAVVMMEWMYQHGVGDRINLGIASDGEIHGRCGWTDGWSADDFLPA